MSLDIKPFEQILAEAITGLVITGGQGGDAAKILARAHTALAVASAFTAINNGDATGIATLQSALANQNLDAGVALAVQSMVAIGAQQLAALSAVNKGLPLIGVTATAIATNIVAGITAAANAEIAKYSTAK